MKKKIVVIGSAGQLGSALKKQSEKFEQHFDFVFADSEMVDITDEDQVADFFTDQRPQICINAAAYTAVDLAESEPEKTFAVNAAAVGFLAENCAKHKALFIHISTDYVFDGDTEISYSEDAFTSPQGVYGASKLEGEELALELNPQTLILRTSWLYSEYGKNFVKTMLQLFSQKEELSIVADQYGQPTNANDLAEAILDIILFEPKTFGIFHFSNYPETTWFGFAKKIAGLTDSKIKLKPITTAEFPTAAKRPMRSTMDLSKIEEIYKITPKHWEHSLEDCVTTLAGD